MATTIDQRLARWKGRLALVTGASYGIGAAIAKNLVQHGLRVVACARNVGEIEKAAAEYKSLNYPGTLIPRQCDLAKENEIEDMFQWIETAHGGVNVCVNNAGYTGVEDLLQISGDQMRHMLGINVIALTLCASKAIKSMRTRGINDGHVLNINSTLGHAVSIFHFYSATKFAVTALTEGFRRELVAANSRIRVSSISPGEVEANFDSTAIGKEGGKVSDEARSKNILQAQDVADAVIFALGSPENAQVHDILLRPTGESLALA